MKTTDIVDAIERFFLDIIGTIVPGAVLILGISWIWSKPVDIARQLPLISNSQYRWIILFVGSYVAGHALTSLGENIVVKGVVRLKKSRVGKALLPRSIIPTDELFAKIKDDPTFEALTKDVLDDIPSLVPAKTENLSVAAWRSIAMSIAPEQRYTVYRFMFISLFNLGIATAFILIAVFWWVLAIIRVIDPYQIGNLASARYSLLLLIASFPFLERRFHFHKTAMEVPFSMALVELRQRPKKAEGRRTTGNEGRQLPKKIYLAGGFKSGWQDKVKLAVPQVSYFDPRSHGLIHRSEYAAWDLQAIESSDCVFAFLEQSNPGGYALALEVGYASAMDKFVILVDEKSTADPESAKHLDMVAETSNVTFKTLEDGIEFLARYSTVV